jgi:hypothetical protein
MKQSILLLTFLLSCFYYNNSHAQHKISAYAGWTASQSINYQSPARYKETSAVLHMPYLGFEYEYDWKKLRLSTGLSVSTLGRSFSAEKQMPVGSMYANIPLIAGVHFELPKNWGLTLEGGAEFGLEISPISVISYGRNYDNKMEGNINAVAGLETQWKQFRFGTRLQIGLTTYMPWRQDVNYKHAGITTYLGYTIWDSKIAKDKRAKQLARKQADKL